MPRMGGPARVLLVLALTAAMDTSQHADAHSRGLYRTRQEAEQRARELGCQGTHQNNGLWMPCSDERMLHRHLREQ
jgi:hypothetical protein